MAGLGFLLLALALPWHGAHAQFVCNGEFSTKNSEQANPQPIKLFAFGVNWYGQQGHPANRTFEPVEISIGNSPMPVIKMLRGGFMHTVAILSNDGKAYMSGKGASGQLGLGTWGHDSVRRFTPVDMVLEGTIPTNLKFPPGHVHQYERIKAIDGAAGWAHTCILLEMKPDNGESVPYCYGSNDKGQLGVGADALVHGYARPVMISGAAGTPNFMNILTGAEYTIALSNDKRTVWAWGSNDKGQTGLASPSVVHLPAQVSIPFSNGGLSELVEFISCGYEHTLLTTSTRRMLGFGSNEYGQLGLSDRVGESIFTPTEITTARSWLNVFAGGYHSAATDENRKLWTFGDGTSGQLGQSQAWSDTTWILSQPTLVPALAGVVIQNVACGMKHTIVLDTCGSVYTFGSNAMGQLGLEETGENSGLPNHMEPVKVLSIERIGLDVLDVGAGGYHSFVITKRA